jgi:hypothetical protein
MPDILAADVARVMAALLEAKAWFRHGLTDAQLLKRTGLPSNRLVVACRLAAARGFVERQGGAQGVTMLTPLGVARAQQDHPHLASVYEL